MRQPSTNQPQRVLPQPESRLTQLRSRSTEKVNDMPQCDVCGNDYDKTIVVTQGPRSMTFDSFECAIEAMAPRCAHCGCRIVGHGVETKDQTFCCAHCARQFGVSNVKDRAA
jgi:hypothetical protein